MTVPTPPLVITDHAIVSANGRLGEPPLTPRAELVRILDAALSAAPANGLVIHFHGGLVPTDYALKELVARLGGIYRTAEAYPLFFVWGSGFMETIKHNAGDLLSDPAFRELVKKVSEWALRKISFGGNVTFRGVDGSQISNIDRFREEFDRFFQGARDTPPSESASIAQPNNIRSRSAALSEADLADEMLESLDMDTPFKDALSTAHDAPVATPPGAGTTPPAATYLDEKAREGMFGPARQGVSAGAASRGAIEWLKVMRYVAGIVLAVVNRYRDGSEHGPYCTVVEEVLRSAYGNLFGAIIWNAMKKDTLEGCAEQEHACADTVLKHLTARAREGAVFSKITLVGHSTGAIYISHFLDALVQRGLDVPVKVAFLAPAITFERFAETIQDYETGPLKEFRMFAMTDALESRDAMLKPFYTRSLLYFVSGLLEGHECEQRWHSAIDMPLLGMERFHAGPGFATLPEVIAAKRFLEGAPGRVVWSFQTDAGPGLNSTATSHGGFDKDKVTCDSLLDFIRN